MVQEAITRFDPSRFRSWSRTSCWRLHVSARTPHPTAAIHLPARMCPPTGCPTPRVRYTPYPGHGDGLSQIPWVRGEPPNVGLVGLLWYWPEAWTKRHLREVRIYTGGVAPGGYNVNILWAFLAPSAKSRAGRNLVVRGRQLDGSATFRQQSFSAIGYAGQRGAPSYASIINVPHTGCWRMDLRSRGLSGHIQLRAVPGRG
jgi:hypothetical protein